MSKRKPKPAPDVAKPPAPQPVAESSAGTPVPSPVPAASGSGFNLFVVGQYVILALLALLLYANTLNHEYALDDGIVVSENQYTKQGLKGIPKLLTTDLFEGTLGDAAKILPGGRWRPLTVVIHAVEYEFFGLNPRVSHAINILLYAALAVLVLALFRVLLPTLPPAVPFVAALLFVVHPVHTESVANIKGRDELLSLFFLLWSTLYFLRYTESRSRGQLWASLGLFFLALTCKENGLLFLGILPLTLYVFRGYDWKPAFRTMLPFAAVSALYFLIRLSILGFQRGHAVQDVLNDPYVNATFIQKYSTIVLVLGNYIQKLLWPADMSFDYSFSQITYVTPANWEFWITFFVNSLILGVGVWLTLRRNAIGWGFLFYLISIFLVSNIPINLGAFMGERLLFQPSLGFILALTLVAYEGLRRLTASPQLVSGALVLLALPFTVLGSLRTVERNLDWKDNETLFLHDVNVCPNSAKTNKAAGEVLIRKARVLPENDPKRLVLLKEAIIYLKKSQSIHPRFTDAYLDCATAYFLMSNYEDSEAMWRKAKEISPNNKIVLEYEKYLSEAAYVQGVQASAGKEKDPNSNGMAEYYFRKALAFQPYNHKAWNALGILMYNNGKIDAALEYWNHAVTGKPDEVEYLNNLGGAYFTKKEYLLALKTWERAATIDPKYRNLQESINAARALAAQQGKH
jgi:tetratricopeptide (TPR) repeat protein